MDSFFSWNQNKQTDKIPKAKKVIDTSLLNGHFLGGFLSVYPFFGVKMSGFTVLQSSMCAQPLLMDEIASEKSDIECSSPENETPAKDSPQMI